MGSHVVPYARPYVGIFDRVYPAFVYARIKTRQPGMPWVQFELPKNQELIVPRDLRIVGIYLLIYDRAKYAEGTGSVLRPDALDYTYLWDILCH